MPSEPLATLSLGEQAFDEFHRDSFEPREHYRALWEQWAQLAAGLTQRLRTLNLFLKDLYHGQRILKDGVVPPERAAVVERGTGVSQDFAHLLVALVRSWGVPARYVTGYVHPGSAPEGTAGTQSVHGWAEVLVPGAGWRGFDAVRGLVANDACVRIAVGRDGRDAAPERAVFHGPPGAGLPDVRLAVLRQQQQQQQQ